MSITSFKPRRNIFMLRKTISLTLALMLALSTFSFSVHAADTPSSWAVEEVNKAISAKLVPAALQSNYVNPTTRAEFCALTVALYEEINGTITGRVTFTDTNDVNVEKMASLNVVSGVGNNKFDPGAMLTREQAATMLARLADALGKPIAKKTAAFNDDYDISSWALEAVGQMQSSGIMGGVGNNLFQPKGTYTREQCILTSLRTYNYIKRTAVTVPTGGGGWAAAYLTVVDNLIAKYGEGRVDTAFGCEYLTGVAIVRLIDFDGDGTKELYCAYANEGAPWANKQVIYGYDNGLVTIMAERDVSNPGTDVSPSTTFLSKGGKVYLIDVNEIVDGRYLEIRDGKVVTVLYYYFDFWEEADNKLNGVVVSEDEIWAACDEMEAGGVVERIDYPFDGDTDALSKTQQAIAELRALAQ